MLSFYSSSFGQKTTKSKVTSVKVNSKLPLTILNQLTDSTERMIVNHSTEFQHIDVPKKFYPTFNGYIKDSAVAELKSLKPILYYNYTLNNGKIINGDIYWNEQRSYILFVIDGKKYVNYFTREGVTQLKNYFKLKI